MAYSSNEPSMRVATSPAAARTGSPSRTGKTHNEPQARAKPGDADAIAKLHPAHARPTRHHLAHSLVARHERRGWLDRPITVGSVEVRVADANSPLSGPTNLARARCWNWQVDRWSGARRTRGRQLRASSRSSRCTSGWGGATRSLAFDRNVDDHRGRPARGRAVPNVTAVRDLSPMIRAGASGSLRTGLDAQELQLGGARP